ncbi:GDSL esterase/lipase 3 [Morus notabilis]|uniref:GDSL esterase/lipase 3 n=1 Tax=Morus notabilis TaxID=981085 RepID=UPI000CED001E|nr:GDSL esterase/lipase 3 [Morus notabilis]
MYPQAVYMIILTTVIFCAAHFKPLEKHVALFVFVDSLYDPVNNNYINTITEYQRDVLCLIPPYLKPGVHNNECGVNFASAGALVQSHQGFVVDLDTQLSYFKKVEKQIRSKLGVREAKELISSAVYLFNVGGNDYLSPFTFNSSLYDKCSKKEYVGMVLGKLTQLSKLMGDQEIYKIGGRKFGFGSLLPLGCLPGTKILEQGNKGSCFEEVTSLMKLHNRELPKALQAIQSQLKGFIYSKHDLYASFSRRSENPSKYGFKEADLGCCGSGLYRGVYSCGGKRGVKEFELCDDVNDYFFFDSYHPTEKAYKQFAKLMWSGNSDITEPFNLKALFEL